MYKIENFLLIKTNQVNLTNVVKQFLKETSLLISNLYTNYIIEKTNKSFFPLAGEEYDAAWYKNLVVAAAIIEDRLNGQINENKQYIDLLNSVNNANFAAFAKRWNVINLLTSFNIANSEWIKICHEYQLHQCAEKLQALIKADIVFDAESFKHISLNTSLYKIVIPTDPQPLIDISTNKNEITTVEVIDQPVPTTEVLADHEDIIPFNHLDIHIANSAANTNIKELNLVLKWLKDNELQIRKYKNLANFKKSPHELNHIKQLIDKLDNEIKSNNDLLKLIMDKLPENPYIEEYVNLAKWTDQRNNTINTHQTIETNNGINTQITNIEKEIKNTEQEIFLIDKTLQLIKEHKPDHPQLKEIEDIFAWIIKKEAMINPSLQNAGNSTVI